MRTRFVCLGILLVTLGAADAALEQASMLPTPPPDVYADNEPWYRSGEPIAYDRAIYHRSGPIIHFVRDEMVPTGTFGDVPIYVRTTEEPGSVVYVPLAGGLMHPYERRRSGDLAGTVGSRSPGFPVVLPSQADPRPDSGIVQTPPEAAAPYLPRPVGTSGAVAGVPAPAARPLAPPARTGRSVDLGDVYIDLKNERWYLAGPAVELDTERFVRTGEYHGFPVYAQRGRSNVIYIPNVSSAPGLLTPYRRR